MGVYIDIKSDQSGSFSCWDAAVKVMKKTFEHCGENRSRIDMVEHHFHWKTARLKNKIQSPHLFLRIEGLSRQQSSSYDEPARQIRQHLLEC